MLREKWTDRADALDAKGQRRGSSFAAKGKPFPTTLLQRREQVTWMRETEFCVVVSQEQGEIAELRSGGTTKGRSVDIARTAPRWSVATWSRSSRLAENPFRGDRLRHVVDRVRREIVGHHVSGQAGDLGSPLMQAIARVNRWRW